MTLISVCEGSRFSGKKVGQVYKHPDLSGGGEAPQAVRSPCLTERIGRPGVKGTQVRENSIADIGGSLYLTTKRLGYHLGFLKEAKSTPCLLSSL